VTDPCPKGAAAPARENFMATAPRPYYTVEEYLAFERGSDMKHEYYAGEIFAMVGASRRHVLIVTNTVGELHAALKGRDCTVYATDMRLRVSPTGLYTYPDVTVVCGRAEFGEEPPDTLLNPKIIIEVLSKSTESYDRTTKFEHYKTLDSVTDYLLISQDAHHVEHHARQTDGTWRSSVAEGLNGVVRLESIGCELRLSELYDKVGIPQ
jgi:Uma2 family endonuclease